MDKIRRMERLVVLTKKLAERPSHLFSLGEFADLFGCAKSTLSEDMMVIRETFEGQGMGTLETVAGAAGGIRFVPRRSDAAIRQILDDMATTLRQPERIIPGGFLYTSDLLFTAGRMVEAGEVFFTRFSALHPDYVMTVETKGIPLAMMTAKAFGVPLVIARQGNKVTEGSSVNINYVTGSAKRIQTMSLARRALPTGARVLLIDDFMKAGASARGLMDLAGEVGAHVVGIGTLIATAEPVQKLVDEYTALLVLHKIDEQTREIDIRAGGISNE